MGILKKRPTRLTEDDFINGNPESVIEQIVNKADTVDAEESESIAEKPKEILTTEKQENNITEETSQQGNIFSTKAQKIMLEEVDENEEPLRRVTTYIKDSLNKKIKLISVLSEKKEYQLWNEALMDLIEKYKQKGL
ncbi:MAG TPA: hypothetical protein PKJ08_06280 [Candidatus Cloacimonadota bacterium]|nr:hypothetical protein [Candidatus Cloacimonadota bacterium]HPM02284.1 hypothetical protein [Candidatus Cloacimonadota bacterium]